MPKELQLDKVSKRPDPEGHYVCNACGKPFAEGEGPFWCTGCWAAYRDNSAQVAAMRARVTS